MNRIYEELHTNDFNIRLKQGHDAQDILERKIKTELKRKEVIRNIENSKRLKNTDYDLLINKIKIEVKKYYTYNFIEFKKYSKDKKDNRLLIELGNNTRSGFLYTETADIICFMFVNKDENGIENIENILYFKWKNGLQDYLIERLHKNFENELTLIKKGEEVRKENRLYMLKQGKKNGENKYFLFLKYALYDNYTTYRQDLKNYEITFDELIDML